LILGQGSDDVTLGTPANAANGISLILNGAGSSTVLANNSVGGYQLWNGATASFTNGGSLTASSSPLVTQ
jgi:hypothetical protein